MTVPTQGDVDEMDRFRKILAGDRSEATKPAPKILENGEEAIVLSTVPDAGAMAKIMEKFASTTGVKSFKNMYDVGENVMESIVDDSSRNRKLKESLATTSTNDGMQIGVWEIRKSLKEGLTKKNEAVYNIRNVSTGQNIKASFLIIESAKTIIRLLSAGATMDDARIRNIAKMEIEYRRFREKALTEKQYWHRAKRQDNELKMDLYEAKFDAAKSKALYVRERIRNLYHQL